MALDVTASKSKFRAIARARGSATYFAQLFQNGVSGDGGTQLEAPQFLHVLRSQGHVSPRICSDDELLAIFRHIDDDHDGKADVDQIIMWFATSRTQRVELPQLPKKSTAQIEDDAVAQKSRHDVERAAASRFQEENPPGLTSFWYKQHAAYSRNYAQGREFRYLLPYNLPLDTVKEKYEDLLEEKEGRNLQWYVKQVLESCGFRLSEATVRKILGRFKLDPQDNDPDTLSLALSEKVELFFGEMLIGTSSGGWEYELRPMPDLRQFEVQEIEGGPRYQAQQDTDEDTPPPLPEPCKLPKVVRSKSRHVARPGRPQYSTFRSARQKWDKDVADGKLRKQGAVWYAYAIGDFQDGGNAGLRRPQKLPPVGKKTKTKTKRSNRNKKGLRRLRGKDGVPRRLQPVA